MPLRSSIVLATTLATLSACAQVAENLPPAASQPIAAAPDPTTPYRIQLGDILTIRVYLSPELDEDVTVRPDGRISTALAQSIPAYGRTPDEIAAALHPAYDHELRNPHLTIELKTPAPQRVYVAGEVATPGEFITPGGPSLTLLQAIARAGGLRVSGDPAHVFILRRGPSDRPIVLAADYEHATHAENPNADIRLAPYDVVYVPKTGINTAYIWFNQHFQQFVPVSWGFSYNVNPLVNGTRQ